MEVTDSCLCIISLTASTAVNFHADESLEALFVHTNTELVGKESMVTETALALAAVLDKSTNETLKINLSKALETNPDQMKPVNEIDIVDNCAPQPSDKSYSTDALSSSLSVCYSPRLLNNQKTFQQTSEYTTQFHEACVGVIADASETISMQSDPQSLAIVGSQSARNSIYMHLKDNEPFENFLSDDNVVDGVRDVGALGTSISYADGQTSSASDSLSTVDYASRHLTSHKGFESNTSDKKAVDGVNISSGFSKVVSDEERGYALITAMSDVGSQSSLIFEPQSTRYSTYRHFDSSQPFATFSNASVDKLHDEVSADGVIGAPTFPCSHYCDAHVDQQAPSVSEAQSLPDTVLGHLNNHVVAKTVTNSSMPVDAVEALATNCASQYSPTSFGEGSILLGNFTSGQTMVLQDFEIGLGQDTSDDVVLFTAAIGTTSLLPDGPIPSTFGLLSMNSSMNNSTSCPLNIREPLSTCSDDTRLHVEVSAAGADDVLRTISSNGDGHIPSTCDLLYMKNSTSGPLNTHEPLSTCSDDTRLHVEVSAAGADDVLRTISSNGDGHIPSTCDLLYMKNSTSGPLKIREPLSTCSDDTRLHVEVSAAGAVDVLRTISSNGDGHIPSTCDLLYMKNSTSGPLKIREPLSTCSDDTRLHFEVSAAGADDVLRTISSNGDGHIPSTCDLLYMKNSTSGPLNTHEPLSTCSDDTRLHVEVSAAGADDVLRTISSNGDGQIPSTCGLLYMNSSMNNSTFCPLNTHEPLSTCSDDTRLHFEVSAAGADDVLRTISSNGDGHIPSTCDLLYMKNSTSGPLKIREPLSTCSDDTRLHVEVSAAGAVDVLRTISSNGDGHIPSTCDLLYMKNSTSGPLKIREPLSTCSDDTRLHFEVSAAGADDVLRTISSNGDGHIPSTCDLLYMKNSTSGPLNTHEPLSTCSDDTRLHVEVSAAGADDVLRTIRSHADRRALLTPVAVLNTANMLAATNSHSDFRVLSVPSTNGALACNETANWVMSHLDMVVDSSVFCKNTSKLDGNDCLSRKDDSCCPGVATSLVPYSSSDESDDGIPFILQSRPSTMHSSNCIPTGICESSTGRGGDRGVVVAVPAVVELFNNFESDNDTSDVVMVPDSSSDVSEEMPVEHRIQTFLKKDTSLESHQPNEDGFQVWRTILAGRHQSDDEIVELHDSPAGREQQGGLEDMHHRRHQQGSDDIVEPQNSPSWRHQHHRQGKKSLRYVRHQTAGSQNSLVRRRHEDEMVEPWNPRVGQHLYVNSSAGRRHEVGADILQLQSSHPGLCGQEKSENQHHRLRHQDRAIERHCQIDELTNSSARRRHEVDDDVLELGASTDNESDSADSKNPSEVFRVAVTHNKSRRIWDKRYYCKFCLKAQSKLPRHMILKHPGEPEVVALASLPLKSEKRKLHLRKLLNDGTYLHNVEVIQNRTGEIIPFKRPASAASCSTFIPCEYCSAMFSKGSLWKHKRRCPFKPSSEGAGSSRRCQGRGSLLLPFSAEASDGFKRDIMSVMVQDDVTAAIRTDDVIMKFGNRLHFKHGHLQHRWQNIRERMRQMGRLLVEVRKTSSVKCLSDCLVPEMFERVVRAVRLVCGFDESSHVFGTPSLALKMGHSLKECTKIQINACVMQTSLYLERKKKHEEFLSLCETEWSHEVSSHALRSLYQRTFNKPLVLPLAEDIKLLHCHLTDKARVSQQKLREKVEASDWSDLCQVTLTQVVIFNRRRGGEAQRIQMSSYFAAASENVNEDIEGCLSNVEKTLCRKFKMVYIEGKRGRKVPVLLTKAAQSQIDLLISTRSSVGIPAENKFLFARRNSLEPHRSSDCLRKFANECGARNPGAITSTKLRKHVATMSQVLALKRNELDLLASFMGHNINVHREFYRLPEQTLQMARVSKVLIAMEHGEIASLNGRSLDDIDVNVPGIVHTFFAAYLFIL
jgi:hypothetical protein